MSAEATVEGTLDNGMKVEMVFEADIDEFPFIGLNIKTWGTGDPVIEDLIIDDLDSFKKFADAVATIQAKIEAGTL